MPRKTSEIKWKKEGRIRLMQLNRPEKMNALTLDGQAEMSKRLIEFRDDEDAWALIITGSGRAFSTGLDLSKAHQTMGAARRAPTLNGPDHLEIWKPVIAAINGYCLGGGCELALACDIRIAAADARIGLPEVKRALIPGRGGIQQMVRAVPRGWAMYLLLTGDWIEAEEARQIGLVQEVVAPEQLLPEARKVAERICQNGPLAVRAVKEAACRGAELPLEAALVQDQLFSFRNRQTEDSREGPRAFAEKRPAVYKGR